MERREDFEKKFGKERFARLMETDPYYKKYREAEMPPGCRWIFSQFMYVWTNAPRDGMSGQVIFTFSTLNDYVACMKTPLTVAEKKLLLKMSHWAKEVIADFEAPSGKDRK